MSKERDPTAYFDYSGNVNQDFELDLIGLRYEEIGDGCALTFRGQMMYFGGASRHVSTLILLTNTKLSNFIKISKIQNCRMDRLEFLPFDFTHGSCTTMASDNIVLLCFGYESEHTCYWSNNFVEWKTSINSNYRHTQTGLGKISEYQAVTTGCSERSFYFDSNDCGRKTEIFSFTQSENFDILSETNWSSSADFPFDLNGHSTK